MHLCSTVVTSSDHCYIETVPPSGDHYCTKKVAPPSDHSHPKITHPTLRGGWTWLPCPLSTSPYTSYNVIREPLKRLLSPPASLCTFIRHPRNIPCIRLITFSGTFVSLAYGISPLGSRSYMLSKCVCMFLYCLFMYERCTSCLSHTQTNVMSRI